MPFEIDCVIKGFRGSTGHVRQTFDMNRRQDWLTRPAVNRVWAAKSDTGRDRVVQTAMLLISEPIFEAD